MDPGGPSKCRGATEQGLCTAEARLSRGRQRPLAGLQAGAPGAVGRPCSLKKDTREDVSRGSCISGSQASVVWAAGEHLWIGLWAGGAALSWAPWAPPLGLQWGVAGRGSNLHARESQLGPRGRRWPEGEGGAGCGGQAAGSPQRLPFSGPGMSPHPLAQGAGPAGGTPHAQPPPRVCGEPRRSQMCGASGSWYAIY